MKPMGGTEGGKSITNITIINPQIMGIWQVKKKSGTRDDTETMGVCVSVWSGGNSVGTVLAVVGSNFGQQFYN